MNIIMKGNTAIAAVPLQRLAEISGAEPVRFEPGEHQVRDQRHASVRDVRGTGLVHRRRDCHRAGRVEVVGDVQVAGDARSPLATPAAPRR
jgi:hypothetical protein